MKLQSTTVSLILALGVFGFIRSSSAAVIAIIDSGTDLSHPELVNKSWTNLQDPDDGVDNDDNGYIDDTHGWNFAENNNKLYEKKLLGKFSPDVYKFFEVQGRALRKQATAEDKAWLQSKRADKPFIQQLGAFGNFVHGTHVAGIAARGADRAQIMPLKLLPTQAVSYLESLFRADGHEAFEAESGSADFREKLVRAGLATLAKAQGVAMKPIGKYVGDKHPQVANCSFGSSVAALKPLFGPLLDRLLGKKLTEAELNDYLSFFIQQSLQSMKVLTALGKDTLFVFAAGNDGTNNDLLPTAPANLKAENSITVAATLGLRELASFSNYGEQMVDLAAPGVGIRSSIPGNAYLSVSGTSQAAPFVANLAGQLWDQNPKLSIAEVKSILVGTVDKKSFLVGKVASGGIANPERAIYAAKMARGTVLTEAIRLSRIQVSDLVEGTGQDHAEAAPVLPLYPMFR